MALAVSMALEPGCWNTAIAGGRLAVQPAVNAVIVGLQFDARDVAQAGDLRRRRRLSGRCPQIPPAWPAGLWAGPPVGTGCPPAAAPGRTSPAATSTFWRRMAATMSLGRQVARRDLVRVNPDAHGIIARAKDDRVPHARQAAQYVLDMQVGVVAQIDRSYLPEGEIRLTSMAMVGERLRTVTPKLPDFLRQARQGQVHAVLHQHLRLVRIGADLKRHRQPHRPSLLHWADM